MKAVNEILKAHGAQGSNLSHCLMAGIMRGHVKLLKPQDDPSNEFGLDQVSYLYPTVYTTHTHSAA